MTRLQNKIACKKCGHRLSPNVSEEELWASIEREHARSFPYPCEKCGELNLLAIRLSLYLHGDKFA